MFRIKRGPVGGMRPMTQFEAPQPQQGADPAMAMLLQKIASLERALVGGPPGQPVRDAQTMNFGMGRRMPARDDRWVEEQSFERERPVQMPEVPLDESPEVERQRVISAAYRQFLGGPASPQELAGYTGMSYEQIAAAVKNSPEARNYAATRRTARTPEWAKAHGAKMPMSNAFGAGSPPDQPITGGALAPRVAYDGGALPVPPAGAPANYVSPLEGESGFDRQGRGRLSHLDPDAPGLMAKYPDRYVMNPKVPTAPPPQVGTGGPRGSVSPIVEKAPPPLPADMAPDDWKARGWKLAP